MSVAVRGVMEGYEALCVSEDGLVVYEALCAAVWAERDMRH